MPCVPEHARNASLSVGGAFPFEPGRASLSPKQAALWGFRSGERGTHTSRTIMFQELSLLLEAAPVDASRERYASLVLELRTIAWASGRRRRASCRCSG